ncbi:MAG: GlcNAc-PI de-N-acetylase [Spirosoma sp.]|nr:GlcNAc-PI de-N-acetylase [Spirosoma sp.]
MNSGVDKAHFLEAIAHPIDVNRIGNALVIAPHPDDESLGCGGTIALLRQQGFRVHVLFVSDGTMSHPNSPSYPAERLRQVRESEALDALRELDVPAENAFFMRQKDTQVATPDSPDFADVVAFVHTLLTDIKPATVLVPWRRDPHRDHRASWQVVNAALSALTVQPKVLEYLIWLWELGDERDMPGHDEMLVWSVPIETVIAQRNKAIAAHRSQVSRLIDDDPTAFYLSPELLMHFNKPRELFLEDRITEPDYA